MRTRLHQDVPTELSETWEGQADLFRLALDQSAVAMCLVRPDGRFSRVNGAICQMLGLTRDELVGRTFQEVTHPDDLAADMAQVERVRSGEIDSYRLFKRFVRPDRGIVFGDLTVTGVRDQKRRLLAFLSQIVDVTGQIEARQETKGARETLRGVIDSLPDPWVLFGAVHGADGRIVDFVYLDANDAACRLNRRSRDELLGSTLLQLLPGHTANGLLAEYAQVVETGQSLVLDDFPYPSELTDGATRWFDNRAVKVGDGLSFTWRDVTDRVRQRQNLAHQAASDPLTGLANRTSLMDGLEALFGGSPLGSDSIAVLYCDLDHFKTINDTLGHEAGDMLLRAVAERIRRTVRQQDLVARIGGDEFVVVAAGVRSEGAAHELAHKISDSVAAPLVYEGTQITPHISIGIAVGREGDDPHMLLRRADSSLFDRKASAGLPALARATS